jgi:uncharacterized protein (TIGR02246 family)
MRELLTVVLFSTLAVSAAAQSTADEKAIRAAFQTMSADWSRADAGAIAKRWTADGDMAVSDGSYARGAAEIQKWFATQFAGPYKGTKFTSTTSSVRFIKPDVAIATGDWIVAGIQGSGMRGGKFTAVLVKESGAWRVTAWRSFVPAKPGPTS